MGDSNDNSDDGFSISNPRILIFIAGMGTAALVVAIYHCVTVGLRNPQRRPLRVRGPSRASTSNPGGMSNSTSTDHSAVQLIPARKYKRGENMLRDDGMCAICLCEFEEGEELRALPECAHSFHVPCIDMWLYSHLNCPTCRADAATPPQIIRAQSIDADREETIVLEHVMVQSRLSRSITQ